MALCAIYRSMQELKAEASSTWIGATRDALAVARAHIVLVAMAGAATFGWLMTGRYLFGLSLVVGLDWFFINLLNRVSDLEEDQQNGIRGTERVARHSGVVLGFGLCALAASIVGLHLVWPALTSTRVAVQLIGLAYNFHLIPTRHGWTRLKELYFFKNSASALLFVLTGFVYPLVLVPHLRRLSFGTLGVLAAFFFLFELTYEILYDLRDVDGDRKEQIPTYPVVHGVARSVQIVDGLLVASAAVLLCGLGLGLLGLREGLMLAAPATQWRFYRKRLPHGLSSHDCIVLTHLGTAQLAFFLIGTALWGRAGLPENLFVPWA